MCGVVGVWRRDGAPDTALVQCMRDTLAYRGPDDAGLWCEGPIAFGHRRLSIVELSPLGHQPMQSADGRFVICFNGEVYNFGRMRPELESCGYRFAGHSDTEVMLAAFSAWGVRDAVRRFIGMFAFAVWDRKERVLHLVRDRLGIKPLYVGRTQAGDFLFASELKALAAHPQFSRRINVDAAAEFLKHGYVPAPGSIYRDAAKLEPGHMLTLSSPDGEWSASPYWSLVDVARDGAGERFVGDASEAAEALDRLLRDAVGLRMIADVPLGAFLSGGVDSSTVVALMQAQSPRPVRTFTIGFSEARFDEAGFARRVAHHLGTDHTELMVRPEDALALIPRLPEMFDEPNADSTQIPTYLVSQLARRHVTVSLSGDGGDELFGGYARYRRTERAWRALGWMTPTARRLLAAGIRAGGALAASSRLQWRLTKVADWLGAGSPDAMYERLVVATGEPAALLATPTREPGAIRRWVADSDRLPLTARFMLADTLVYLPDDLLSKLDRASMAVSLEGRVPILDHRVVEFAWRLPMGLRTDKLLLKRVLSRYVPRSLFDRPKMGFEIPLAQWLRGPLRRWAADLLTSGDFGGEDLFDRKAVAAAWDRFALGRGGDPLLLWSLVTFETWRRHWRAEM